MHESLVTESIKIVPTAVVSAVDLLATWFVGERIVTAWQIRQRMKELQLAAVGELPRVR